jgi:hypothetical protein
VIREAVLDQSSDLHGLAAARAILAIYRAPRSVKRAAMRRSCIRALDGSSVCSTARRSGEVRSMYRDAP